MRIWRKITEGSAKLLVHNGIKITYSKIDENKTTYNIFHNSIQIVQLLKSDNLIRDQGV